MGRARRANRTVATVDTGVGRVEVGRWPEDPDALVLAIDGNVHGVVALDDPSRLHVDYQARLVSLIEALLPVGPASLIHLGGGAVVVPRALRARRTSDAGPLHQLVIERSGAVIDVARNHLGLRTDSALAIRKGDARAVLARQPDASADLVIADVFVELRTPRHLGTVEFVAEVARVLRPGGRYVVNLVDEAPWSVLGGHAVTVESVLPEVLAIGARGVAALRDPGNVILLAGRDRVDRTELGHRLAVGAHPSALVRPGRLAELVRRHRPRHDADG